MSRTTFVAGVLLVLALAGAMRLAWLRSDPPVAGSVGIVWHDEGAWVHNARNRVLFGEWRTDNWNPLFIAPVFTALEYAAFEAFGVGTWQARIVPAASGMVAVVFVMAGLSALASRRAAVLGGALLAANYAFVMWNRAALMESTMTMWLVVAWAAYARADKHRAWAAIAGSAAAAAWFTKAAAAFFIAALVLEVVFRRPSLRTNRGNPVSLITLASLALVFAVVGLTFVLPNWTEYQFYNWQMSVTRKPDYSIGAFVDRATWIPVVQSIFSRMWIELSLGSIGLLSVIARWKHAQPAERLLVLWVIVGLAELVVHDSGNERRYVMFIPAFVALAALHIDRATTRAAAALDARPMMVPVLIGAVATMAFVVAGSGIRPFFIDDILAHQLRVPVRLSLAMAAVAGAATLLWRRRLIAWFVSAPLPAAIVVPLVAVAFAGQFWQYGSWIGQRAELNYQAAVAIGRELPRGTLVQGKLANGLSLESQIKPLFVGNGFGNYEDRLRRDDARYILTYDLPRIGYESSDGSGLIQGILEQYPRHRIVDSFIVDETPLPDRAVLIDKIPDGQAGHARD